MLIMAAMFATLIVPLILGAPIAVALGGAGLLWLVAMDVNLLRGAGYALWNNANSVTLLAIPLFLFMGQLVQRTDLSVRFYRAVSLWIAWLPGGLLHSNVAACSVFSAVSGSSVATAATVGTSAVPELSRLGYDRRLIAGTLAAGGTLGILIPPSIAMIIYGAMTETSIGRLFMAGVLPGLMMIGIFFAYVFIRSVLKPSLAPRLTDSIDVPWGERVRALADVLPIAMIITIIMAGIYTGMATPTEVGAVGVAAAMIVGLIYRRLTWRVFSESLHKAIRFSSMILFVILGAQIFSFALFSWGVTFTVSSAVADLDVHRLLVLLIIIGMYIFIGMFIDAISMMVLTLSIVFPIVTQLGYDPIWFGVILVLLLEVGLITPPVGLNLYTIQGIMPKTSIVEIVRGTLPFVLLLLFGIAILIAFPGIALWLPEQAF